MSTKMDSTAFPYNISTNADNGHKNVGRQLYLLPDMKYWTLITLPHKCTLKLGTISQHVISDLRQFKCTISSYRTEHNNCRHAKHAVDAMSS